MRNKEYRDMLIETKKQLIEQRADMGELCQRVREAYISNIEFLLSKYDRLHPETLQVEQAKVTDRRGYKDLPADRHGCVTVFDNLNGCNIQIIDNVLNVTIE